MKWRFTRSLHRFDHRDHQFFLDTWRIIFRHCFHPSPWQDLALRRRDQQHLDVSPGEDRTLAAGARNDPWRLWLW